MARTPIDARPPEGAEPYMARLLELIAADARPVGDLAHVAGIPRASFYQIRAGHRLELSGSTLARILSALGRSWGDLDTPAKQVRPRKPKAKAAR